MEGEVLIKVEDLSKKFCRDLKRSLRYGLQDMAGEITGRPRTDSLREKEFWAVKDIGFEVRRGECLGLIGHNGAGKTTLLRMLNGLIKPDQGRIEIRGTVGALIALGAGFNPILTGRENIYVNAAVLGLSKARVDEKLEEILAFAELGEFIDMPVQHYSSGMSVRLGFAVAAILIEPDILFLDEVLAVGDISFTIKCLNRVRELMRTSAVVFVSHNMPLISSFCTRVLVMDHGHTVLDTDQPGVAINHYYGLVSGTQQVSGSGEAKVLEAQLEADGTERKDGLVIVPQGADGAVMVHLDTTGVSGESELYVHVDDATPHADDHRTHPDRYRWRPAPACRTALGASPARSLGPERRTLFRAGGGARPGHRHHPLQASGSCALYHSCGSGTLVQVRASGRRHQDR